MSSATLNGTEIAFFDSGGDGPAIVLSHGFLMDHTMFDAQVAALSGDTRVITWDERGFGGTRAVGPFSFWDSAADLLALLDHLDIDRAVLGGMSQGGFVSLRAALLAPERVRGLVLIDTQSGQEDPSLVDAYDQLHATWLEHGPAPVQEIISSIILGPGLWDGWYTKWSALEPDQFTAAYRCLMDRDDITGRVGEITAPALIVHGTDDRAIPISKGEALRDDLGGEATLVRIEGGAHASNLTHPEAVNAAIVAFLLGLDPV